MEMIFVLSILAAQQIAAHSDVITFQELVCQHCSSVCGQSSGPSAEARVALPKILPRSCDDVDYDYLSIPVNSGGAVYLFDPAFGAKSAFCYNTDGGAWTVFQRRMDGSVDFFRDWNDFVHGFGDVTGEFWLGLEAIHQLTKDGGYELLIDMRVTNGTRLYAKYSSFALGSRSGYYPLRVGGYSGNATDSLAYQNNQKFTTKDADNDPHKTVNCAAHFKGAWWHRSCHYSSLNGLYGTRSESGIVWNDMDSGLRNMYMSFTEMKFRKKQ